jgi:hypothetical protein
VQIHGGQPVDSGSELRQRIKHVQAPRGPGSGAGQATDPSG